MRTHKLGYVQRSVLAAIHSLESKGKKFHPDDVQKLAGRGLHPVYPFPRNSDPDWGKQFRRVLWALCDRGYVTLDVGCLRGVCAGEWSNGPPNTVGKPNQMSVLIGQASLSEKGREMTQQLLDSDEVNGSLPSGGRR